MPYCGECGSETKATDKYCPDCDSLIRGGEARSLDGYLSSSPDPNGAENEDNTETTEISDEALDIYDRIPDDVAITVEQIENGLNKMTMSGVPLEEAQRLLYSKIQRSENLSHPDSAKSYDDSTADQSKQPASKHSASQPGSTTPPVSEISQNKSHSDYALQVNKEYPENWDVLRKQVYKRDEYECQNCGSSARLSDDVELHAHHIVSLANDGNNVLSNLVTLCSICHGLIHEHLD